jgi:hypothetical protein
MVGAAHFGSRARLIGGAMGLLGLLAIGLAMMLSPHDVAIAHQADASVPGGSQWSAPIYTGGLASFVLGVGIALASFVRRKPKPGTATRETLRPLIESRALPFSVCSACRIVIDSPNAFNCPQCDSLEHCIRVEEDSERSMALAALPLE